MNYVDPLDKKKTDVNPEAALQAMNAAPKNILTSIMNKQRDVALNEVTKVLNLASNILDHGLLTVNPPSMNVTPDAESLKSMKLIENCLKTATSNDDSALKINIISALDATTNKDSLNDVANKLKGVLERSGINPQNNTSFVARPDQSPRTNEGNKLIV